MLGQAPHLDTFIRLRRNLLLRTMQCFVQSVVTPKLAKHVSHATCSLRQSSFDGSVYPRGMVAAISRVPNPQRDKCIRRCSLITMENDSSGVSLATRIGAVITVVGLVVTTFLPAVGVFRNAVTDSGDSLVDYQLSKVPIFTVTDASGRPFLAETEDHRLRLGYFFVQPADAESYLERVKAENADAKVLTIGLNEAVKFLDTKSTPAKSIPERFNLFPDEHEADIAQQVTDGAFQKAFGPSGVPIFYVDGLGIKDSKEDATVFPLFFEKEKLDETIATLKKRDPSSTVDVKDLQVIDLRQTIKEIRTGGNPKLNRVVFVPLTESLKAMKVKQGE